MQTGSPRFGFYEKVTITTTDSAKAEIDGHLGAVLGRACGSDGIWYYAIWCYGLGLTYSCREDELSPTGEFDRQETFFDGASIRVSRRGELLG